MSARPVAWTVVGVILPVGCAAVSCGPDPAAQHPPAPDMAIDIDAVWPPEHVGTSPAVLTTVPIAVSSSVAEDATSSTWDCFYISRIADDNFGACARTPEWCQWLYDAVRTDDKVPCIPRVNRIKPIFYFSAAKPVGGTVDIGALSPRACQTWLSTFKEKGMLTVDHCNEKAAR